MSDGNRSTAGVSRSSASDATAGPPSTSVIVSSRSSGSTPRENVRQACGSRSTSRTRCSNSPSAAPNEATVVVFATPPFWFVTATTRVTLSSSKHSAQFSSWSAARDGRLHLGTVNGVSAPPFLTLPATVRPAQVVTSRGEFAVLEAGSAGPTVLLVPGWTGSKEDFVALLAPLAAAGYHAVSLDQRGQYETPGSTLESDYSLTDLADDLLSVATEIAPASVHVVGHSFGGLVARSAAIADPDAIASLTLLGSGPGAQPVERHDLLRAMANVIPAIGLEATWQAKRAYERSQGAPEPPPEIELFMQQRFLANHPTSLRVMTLHLTTAPDQ